MTTERIDPLDSIRRAKIACQWERDQNEDNGNESAAVGWEQHRADLQATHSAVAELVEAGRDVSAFKCDASLARLNAALAAFGRQG